MKGQPMTILRAEEMYRELVPMEPVLMVRLVLATVAVMVVATAQVAVVGTVAQDKMVVIPVEEEVM
jgi:hypothetical protein